jgi:hypothetical protein
MENVTPNDVVNAIDFLLSHGYRGDYQRVKTPINNAIQIISQSFYEGTISSEMVLKAIKSLLGLEAFDYRNKWGDVVFNAIQGSTMQSCKDEIVVAIVEALIDLESTQIIGKLLNQNERHPAFFETLIKGAKNKENQTVMVITKSIKKYLEHRQYLEVSDEVYETLMTMLIFGTDYACSGSTELMIEIVRNNSPFRFRIDDLTFLWNRVYVLVSNPEWSWKYPYDVYIILRFLGCLAAQDNETLLKLPSPKLPYPLDELPADPYNAVVFKAVFEMENEMCHKDYASCDNFKHMGAEIRGLLHKPEN